MQLNQSIKNKEKARCGDQNAKKMKKKKVKIKRNEA